MMKVPGCNIVLMLAALLLLAACGTTPQSRHYLLTAAEAPLPTGDSPALGIGPVTLSEYLNRNALVRRSGSNQLQVSTNERWGEPLEDGITRVLGLNLATMLESGSVLRHPWNPARHPEYAIRMHVVEMDASSTQATLIVDWQLYRPADGERLERHLRRQTRPLPAAAEDSNALVSLYSDMLLTLSKEIAEAIRIEEAKVEGDPL